MILHSVRLPQCDTLLGCPSVYPSALLIMLMWFPTSYHIPAGPKRREVKLLHRSKTHSYNKMSFIHWELSLKLFFADDNLCLETKLSSHPGQNTYGTEIMHPLQYFYCDHEQNLSTMFLLGLGVGYPSIIFLKLSRHSPFLGFPDILEYWSEFM